MTGLWSDDGRFNKAFGEAMSSAQTSLINRFWGALEQGTQYLLQWKLFSRLWKRADMVVEKSLQWIKWGHVIEIKGIAS